MPYNGRINRANLPSGATLRIRIRTMLLEIQRRIEDGGMDSSRDTSDIHRRLQTIHTQVMHVESIPNLDIGLLQDALGHLVAGSSTLHLFNPQSEVNAFIVNRIQSSHPGVCPYDVSENHVRFLYSHGFSSSQMLRVLQPISRATLYRRLTTFGIRLNDRYTTISDEDLHTHVETLHQRYPRVGQRMMLSLLRAQGVYVQRNRVRTLLRAIDPMGTVVRWSNVIQRRRYHVPHPNYLWHLDSNHALIM